MLSRFLPTFISTFVPSSFLSTLLLNFSPCLQPHRHRLQTRKPQASTKMRIPSSTSVVGGSHINQSQVPCLVTSRGRVLVEICLVLSNSNSRTRQRALTSAFHSTNSHLPRYYTQHPANCFPQVSCTLPELSFFPAQGRDSSSNMPCRLLFFRLL